MLESLRHIVQQVNSAPNLRIALDTLVLSLKEAIKTEVVSVYLYNSSLNRYVLMATEGLNKNAIGYAGLGFSEGLVGQVGLKQEPVNIENASLHPKYHYIPEIGEEPFHSFLGVPIIHQRKIRGVLVVQDRAHRRFDEDHVAFLVTLSAQIAGSIDSAEARGELYDTYPQDLTEPDVNFIGVVASPGVAIGEVVVAFPPADLDSVPDRPSSDVDAEMAQLQRAVFKVKADMQTSYDKLSNRVREEELELFNAYIHMLDDESLTGEIQQLICQGQWVQTAVKKVILGYVASMEGLEDLYLRDRAADIKDLGRRVLAYLQQENSSSQREYPERTILMGEEITPYMLSEVPREKLAGLITLSGSTNSHFAILARAMEVPAVIGSLGLPLSQLEGRELIVDGYHGKVYGSFSRRLRMHFEQIMREDTEKIKDFEKIKHLPCETPDGHRIALWANTGLMTDVVRALERGAEGIGLYRSEIPFMIRERFPSEQEQFVIYREQLQAFAPAPVTMRTLDIGGDKSLSYFPIEEANPYLGWRGVRVTLDHPEIFMVQVKAMIRASEGLDNLRILLPMVSNISEVEEALHLVHRAYTEIKELSPSVVMPMVGVMIEVPAAVFQIEALAQLADFVSVGSNDLIQYLIAVDRNNPRVADLFHDFHPAVLDALERIVQGAHLYGKDVGICGEMAGDPYAAVLLLAMGFDSLSMNCSNLSKVKEMIRRVPFEKAQALLSQIKEMDEPHVVRSWVELSLEHQRARTLPENEPIPPES